MYTFFESVRYTALFGARQNLEKRLKFCWETKNLILQGEEREHAKMNRTIGLIRGNGTCVAQRLSTCAF